MLLLYPWRYFFLAGHLWGQTRYLHPQASSTLCDLYNVQNDYADWSEVEWNVSWDQKCVQRVREKKNFLEFPKCLLHFMMAELWGLPNSYNNIWLHFISTFKGASLPIGQQIFECPGVSWKCAQSLYSGLADTKQLMKTVFIKEQYWKDSQLLPTGWKMAGLLCLQKCYIISVSLSKIVCALSPQGGMEKRFRIEPWSERGGS